MNKLKRLIILTSLIFFSMSGYAQILANGRTEILSIKELSNNIKDQIPDTISKAKQVKICLCCSTKKQEPILWVIKLKKKEYVLNEAIAIGDNLNPQYISKLEVFKDSTSLSKYGQAAKNGVIIVSIATDYDKEVFKRMKRYLTNL